MTRSDSVSIRVRHEKAVRRAPVEWGVRALLAVVAACLAYVSVGHTFAYSLRRTAVERAHGLAGSDGRITALLSQKMLAEQGVAAGPEAAILARTALRSDATAVAAVSTLGLDAQAHGRTQEARKWFTYASALSRRDFQTQLWLIEDAVSRGDVGGALHHYDVALRTSASAPDILYPVLISAIENLDVRKGMARILAARPVWASSFLLYTSGNAPDLRAMADLFHDVSRRGGAISSEAQAYAVDRLVKQRDLEMAWHYYAGLRGVKDRNRSRDQHFTADLPFPSTMDWNPASGGEIVVSLQRGDGHGVVDFSGPPNIGGVLLRQTQLLAPGSYVLEGHSANVDLPEGAAPYWTLICDNGRELGRVAVPNSGQNHGNFVGRFTVPAGCPVQSLALVATPVNNQTGLSGQIDAVALRPRS